MMKFLFTVAVVASFFCYAMGTCAGGASGESRTNANCSWYNANSCCSEAIANAAMGGVSGPCGAPETKCQELINLLSCGVACSPDISSAIDGASIKICSKFADHIYSSCSSSKFPDSTGTCKVISDAYSDSKTFWTQSVYSAVFTYDTTDSAPACFNAGSLASPMLALTVLALIAMIFTF